MARHISDKLKKRLVEGDLKPLLDYLKSHTDDLRLEVRPDGEAFVYYKKSKALEIGAMYVDPKYGDVPDTSLAQSNPKDYFDKIKACIDVWPETVKKRNEFETQQGIATSNQDKNDKYIILDMEYRFPREEIEENRPKQAGFDLLGVERKTGKVVFFEVKTGTQSLTGTSGIAQHIGDFEQYLYGEHRVFFRKHLETDIRYIVADKKELGILKDFDLPKDFTVDNPSFVFVFEPCGPNDKADYEKTFADQVKKAKTDKQYGTIYVSKEGGYKLK